MNLETKLIQKSGVKSVKGKHKQSQFNIKNSKNKDIKLPSLTRVNSSNTIENLNLAFNSAKTNQSNRSKQSSNRVPTIPNTIKVSHKQSILAISKTEGPTITFKRSHKEQDVRKVKQNPKTSPLLQTKKVYISSQEEENDDGDAYEMKKPLLRANHSEKNLAKPLKKSVNKQFTNYL